MFKKDKAKDQTRLDFLFCIFASTFLCKDFFVRKTVLHLCRGGIKGCAGGGWNASWRNETKYGRISQFLLDGGGPNSHKACSTFHSSFHHHLDALSSLGWCWAWRSHAKPYKASPVLPDDKSTTPLCATLHYIISHYICNDKSTTPLCNTVLHCITLHLQW